MGICISKLNRGRLGNWTSTTLGCILAGFILLLAGAAVVALVCALIYGIHYLATGHHVHGRSEPTFWNTFGNTVQHNHVKRMPSFEHRSGGSGSPTPSSRKTPEFTITQTPVTNAPSSGPTTTSAVVDGHVVTYVFYSPRTWLTLAAVPHRSAIPQTRYSETQRIVDYSMRSWTEDQYFPVQTVISSFSTETLSGPITIGTDGSLGTATGTLENAFKFSFRTAKNPAVTAEVASNPALFWIPTGSLKERDAEATEETKVAEAMAVIMTNDDEDITMFAPAPETTVDSVLFTSDIKARNAVATPTESAVVTTDAPSDDKLFWIPPVDIEITPIGPYTMPGTATTEGPPAHAPFRVPTGVFEAEKVEVTETAVTETPSEDALFWIPTGVVG